jgi:hypothetical protein
MNTSTKYIAIDPAKLEAEFNQYYPINGDVCNKIMNMYHIGEAQTIYETYGLDAVMHGSFIAIVSNPVIVDIDKIVNTLRKTYTKPTKNNSIKYKHYRNACGIINTLSLIGPTIINYEKMRLTMMNPKNYVQFKYTPTPKIIKSIYENNIIKCCNSICNKSNLCYEAIFQKWPYPE